MMTNFILHVAKIMECIYTTQPIHMYIHDVYTIVSCRPYTVCVTIHKHIVMIVEVICEKCCIILYQIRQCLVWKKIKYVFVENVQRTGVSTKFHLTGKLCVVHLSVYRMTVLFRIRICNKMSTYYNKMIWLYILTFTGLI